MAVALLAVLVLGPVCGGCTAQSKRHMYAVASQAVKADSGFPAGAKLGPVKDAEVHIAKNAASVRLPFEVAGESGAGQTGFYTVWLKRIGIRWEVDRLSSEPHAWPWPGVEG